MPMFVLNLTTEEIIRLRMVLEKTTVAARTGIMMGPDRIGGYRRLIEATPDEMDALHVKVRAAFAGIGAWESGCRVELELTDAESTCLDLALDRASFASEVRMKTEQGFLLIDARPLEMEDLHNKVREGLVHVHLGDE